MIMYKLKEIKHALKILEQYDFQFSKTSKATGIKVRTIRCWYNKQKEGKPLLTRPNIHTRKGKWTVEEKKAILDYYFSHGENCSIAVRVFGYPTTSTMRYWVRKDKRYKQKHFIINKPKKFTEEEKKEIVVEFAARKGSGEKIANKYGTSKETIYNWQRNYIGSSHKEKIDKSSCKYDDLVKENEKLLLENKILKKANEILKKEMGDNFSSLTNKEKTQIVIALKKDYKVSDILPIIDLKKSTYFYEIKSLSIDKYKSEKDLIIKLFHNNYECYGYRRIKASLFQEYGIKISEKVVRKLMKKLNLSVYVPKRAKYSSYKGEISPESENIINRDFKANEPYSKSLTDITEFSLCDGKVYLSPLIDCFTGIPITYTIGKSPNTELTNTMLDQAHEIIGDSNMIVHSDRGFHYRLGCWINRMDKYGYIRSMSKKGCSPDNSACEGFFGTIKNEFFYPRDWRLITTDQFIVELEKYLNWFCNKRIKKRLNYLNRNQYMINYQKQVQ